MSIWSWSRGRQRLERVQLTKQELCRQEFAPMMKTHPNVWSQLTEYMRQNGPIGFPSPSTHFTCQQVQKPTSLRLLELSNGS
ncbi:hypothetical protein DPMN_034845 [Dreissena polymorpha]|uniref:Uncharacterized protein n=1 Tax=Dreissena polymorpha TaxID=45954 RepID=A0A9D4M873_DREPO|nr:hypothetical protein DPMN_034845 [Dreissena polymorpha]